LLYGGIQGFRSVRSWQATHAAWSAADAALAHDALSVAGSGGRAVCFSACAPIDYYTSLPVMELYAHDQADLEAFIVPGSTAVVVPEQSLATQWAGEEVARRWEWLASTYVLERVGARGEDTVFSVKSR
jgi:hypothetical protein